MWLLVLQACLLPAALLFHAAPAQSAEPRFEVFFAAPAHDGPLTGRILVAVAKAESPDPIQQIGSYTGKTPFFGIDVEQLPPGRAATVDTRALGYPANSLKDVPAGDYNFRRMTVAAPAPVYATPSAESLSRSSSCWATFQSRRPSDTWVASNGSEAR